MRRPIARALRIWRVKEGLSQAQVADMVGISQPAVSATEHHTHELKESTIERYAAGYRMDPLDFLLAILAYAKANPDEK